MKSTFKHEIIYTFKWQLSFNSDYKITECKKVINTKTGNILKECLVGYTLGYWIGRKFIAKKRLYDYCEIIEKLTLIKLKHLYPTLYATNN